MTMAPPSIYVKFPLKDDISDLMPALKSREADSAPQVSMVIWTHHPLDHSLPTLGCVSIRILSMLP